MQSIEILEVNMNYESLIPLYILEEKKQKILQQYDQIDEKSVNQEFIEIYVEMIESDDIVKQHFGLLAIRRLISINQNPNSFEITQAIIESSIVPKLMQIVDLQSNQLFLFEALWILTNIASGTNQQTQVIVKNGAIPILLKHLNSKHYNILEQVFWAIGNIAADEDGDFRNIIIQQGGLFKIVQISEKLMKENRSQLVKLCSWTLRNLSRGNPNQYIDKYKRQIINLFTYIINKFDDQETLFDAYWGLYYISNSKNGLDSIQEIINTGIIDRFIQLLKSNCTVQIIALDLRIIKKILGGSQSQKEYVLNKNIIDNFAHLLTKLELKSIRREICQCLSNIIAGNQSQIKRLINNDQILKSLESIFIFENVETQIEIAFIFSNALKYINQNDILRLVDYGVLQIFGRTLGLQTASSQQKIEILNSSDFILKNVSSLKEEPKKFIMEQLPIFQIQNDDKADEKLINCKEEYFIKWQRFIEN
ncbi:unnamed protein product [Paramecium sonneborni]|uniref:Importin subunit alpha n=1 Tax=Paramecium sonneborni TaxID=65129 RepID=A0A8S1N2S4_9CILI|nr:unnamed protein product [Paramecium sonneborni]